MVKLKPSVKTALVLLIGYAAHQGNPQYEWNVGASPQGTEATQRVIERPRYSLPFNSQYNSQDAFARWASAYQARLNQGELTAER